MPAVNARIPLELVEELERRFPVKRPLPGQSLDSVFEYSGKVAVVEFLRNSYEEQQESSLSSPLDLFTGSTS